MSNVLIGSCKRRETTICWKDKEIFPFLYQNALFQHRVLNQQTVLNRVGKNEKTKNVLKIFAFKDFHRKNAEKTH